MSYVDCQLGFSSDSLTCAFSHGYPNLSKIQIRELTDNEIPYARALIGRITVATVGVLRIELEVDFLHLWREGRVNYGSYNVWNAFDIFLFVVYLKTRVSVRIRGAYPPKEQFPLMTNLGFCY